MGSDAEKFFNKTRIIQKDLAKDILRDLDKPVSNERVLNYTQPSDEEQNAPKLSRLQQRALVRIEKSLSRSNKGQAPRFFLVYPDTKDT